MLAWGHCVVCSCDVRGMLSQTWWYHLVRPCWLEENACRCVRPIGRSTEGVQGSRVGGERQSNVEGQQATHSTAQAHSPSLTRAHGTSAGLPYSRLYVVFFLLSSLFVFFFVTYWIVLVCWSAAPLGSFWGSRFWLAAEETHSGLVRCCTDRTENKQNRETTGTTQHRGRETRIKW